MSRLTGALADACGRPVAFILTPGNIADNIVATALLVTVSLLGDKAGDIGPMRQLLAQHKVEAINQSSARYIQPILRDRLAYKRRNRIKRMFSRIKDWRRIATRYDRRCATTCRGRAAPLGFQDR